MNGELKRDKILPMVYFHEIPWIFRKKGQNIWTDRREVTGLWGILHYKKI